MTIIELRIYPHFLPSCPPESITLFNDLAVAREAAYDLAREFSRTGRESYTIALFQNLQSAGLIISR